MLLKKPVKQGFPKKPEGCSRQLFFSEATAAAALKGQVAWSNAMEGATKVRDAYSRRSHELSQALVKVCVFFGGRVGVGRLQPRGLT